MYKYNNQLTLISVFNIEAHPLTTILALPFNSHMKEALINRKAVAGCNALVKNDVIGAYWVIIDQNNKSILIEREMYTKE